MLILKRLLNLSHGRFSRIPWLPTRSSSVAILGIETSCDDTGCAIVDENGKILGEALHSQHHVHAKNGGIIPDIAQDFHRNNIEPIVAEALSKASLKMEDITAIAVTLEPGLPLSLVIGMKYAKHLARRYDKPMIPIHHMEAHALAARMQFSEIKFPYLVLLISGGHCLLAVAQDIDKFILLGESIDNAPGEMFDKLARRMKLRNIPEYRTVCGGRAVELAAEKATNPKQFNLPLPLAQHKDCNFSFSGLLTSVLRQVNIKETEHNILGNEIIPEVNDLCAAAINTTAKHLIHRIQRGVEFSKVNNLLECNSRQQLVVSGGVACNNIIFKALQMLCSDIEFELYRPTNDLCTDNGIMIAWNGLEKWKRNIDITKDFNKLDIKSESPLGTSMIEEVKKANLTMKVMKTGL